MMLSPTFSNHVSLETGELTIEINNGIHHLTGFAARNNSKRGFLFLSKVIGKHYPSCPLKMKEIHVHLSNLVKPKLETGPTVVVGFCETATGLGYGIFEELNLTDSFYQHSTRHKIDHPLFIKFNEDHSHAESHYFYLPQSLKHLQILQNAANIVFVDDEFTTGNTLKNAIFAFRGKNIFANFIGVGILDWTSEIQKKDLPDIVSYFKGSYTFKKKEIRKRNNYVSFAESSPILPEIKNCYGRVGTKKLAPDFENILKYFPSTECEVLVLGTGEFMNVAYLLGLFLKSYTKQVFVQSTTRSPILLGNDVNSLLYFKDNYSENIDNFLYNVSDKHYDVIYVCYETDYNSADQGLVSQLKKLFKRVYVYQF